MAGLAADIASVRVALARADGIRAAMPSARLAAAARSSPTVSISERGLAGRTLRVAVIAAVALTCIGGAALAGWWMRGESRVALAAATATPTSTSTSTSPPMRSRTHRAPPAHEIKDPYGDAADLKPDPFR
jgi:hypothetical protein